VRFQVGGWGSSGLGLDAQREAVQRHLASVGGTLIAEHVEVESDKDDRRPELQKALAVCRRQRAKLLIAKLDRLSRNVAFIAGLMDGNTEFVACGNPHATRLALHILAAVAEHEREAISQRTKAVLQTAKGVLTNFVARRLTSLTVNPRARGALGDQTDPLAPPGRRGGGWPTSHLRFSSPSGLAGPAAHET
jgi:hypothetical protein